MPDGNQIEALAQNMKVTASCRFIAAARLDKRDKSSNVVVSVYSALLICLSLAAFSLLLSSSLIRYVSFFGVAASILLLVMSMRNFAHKFGVEAEQMHRSALEINEIRRNLLALPEGQAIERLSYFTNQYNSVLQKWSVNHDEDDFLKYKYNHKWEFEDIKNIPDKNLPDRKFQEKYDATAGALVGVIVIGFAVIIFVGYIVWDSISTDQQISRLESYSSPNAKQAMEAAQSAASDAAVAASEAAASMSDRHKDHK